MILNFPLKVKYNILSKASTYTVASIFLFIGFFTALKAQDIPQKVVYLPTLKEDLLNNLPAYYLKDNSDKLTIYDILKSNKKFQIRNEIIPNFGLVRHTVWTRYIVNNLSLQNEYFLGIDHSLLDNVTFYHVQGNQIDSSKISIERPFRFRDIHHQNLFFPFLIETSKTDTFYLKVNGIHPMILPAFISNEKLLYESINRQDLIFGIYTGIILVMIIYNFFLFISLRDKSYLYFCIYALFVGLTQGNLLGYNFRFIWPNSPYLEIHSASIIPALVGIFSIVFIRSFLESKRFMPILDGLLQLVQGIYFIVIAIDLLNFTFLSQVAVYINAFMASSITLIVSWRLAWMGSRKAIFFVIAWLLFLVCVLLFVLKSFDIIPAVFITKYILVIGSSACITLLSLAFADNINQLKREKEESQAQALRELGKNEILIRDQNLILEKKVHERTSQLRLTMEDLNKTMDDLKEAQSALVDSEKMVSLGQLTAGIAHEINNPINFVTSNINPLKRDIEDVYSLLDIMEESSKVLPDEKFKEIQKAKKSLDIDFVKDEINLLLRGIEEGAIRTSEIIRGLKNFARVDEQDLKEVNLNEGIESTLLLLRNKTKGEIQIELDLNEIPSVHCYAGKMNQVFMNILSNSIYALNSHYSNGEGIIQIQTRKLNSNEVQIRFKDNGPGIPKNIQSKIFEPFFTTKPVGEGTGLGLSIVHTIVESHKGQIFLNSSPELGTEFLIILPITH